MFRSIAVTSAGVGLLMLIAACQTSRPAGAAAEAEDLVDRIVIGRGFTASHSDVFDAAERALGAQGYTIAERRRLDSMGFLTTAPRYAWTGCLKDDIERTSQHPGVAVIVETRRESDSTRVMVAARTTRAVPDVVVNGDTMNVALPLQLCAMTMVISAIDSLVSR